MRKYTYLTKLKNFQACYIELTESIICARFVCSSRCWIQWKRCTFSPGTATASHPSEVHWEFILRAERRSGKKDLAAAVSIFSRFSFNPKLNSVSHQLPLKGSRQAEVKNWLDQLLLWKLEYKLIPQACSSVGWWGTSWTAVRSKA